VLGGAAVTAGDSGEAFPRERSEIPTGRRIGRGPGRTHGSCLARRGRHNKVYVSESGGPNARGRRSSSVRSPAWSGDRQDSGARHRTSRLRTFAFSAVRLDIRAMWRATSNTPMTSSPTLRGEAGMLMPRPATGSASSRRREARALRSGP